MMKNALLLAKNIETPTFVLMRKVLDSLGARFSLSAKLPSEARPKDCLVINRNFGMDYDDADLNGLESAGFECLNPVPAQRLCRDKALSLMWLAARGLPQPRFWRAVEELPDEGPFVFKTLRGMQGRGVWLCKDQAEVKAQAKSLGDHNFLVQEHVNFDREFRCLIVGEETVWFEKSGGNLYQGGKALKILEPPVELKRQARLINRDLGLRLGAIDFIQGKSGFIALDLNAYPGLKMLEDSHIYLRRLFLDALS